MNRIIYILLLFFYSAQIKAQVNVSIGLYTGSKIKSIGISSVNCGGLLISDSLQILFKFKKNQMLHISASKDSVVVKSLDSLIGIYKSFQLVPSDSTLLRIKSIQPDLTSRQFEGQISFCSKGENLLILNNVDLNRYVAGVIEAEAGSGHTLEYYKVQAIICRTYALSHLNRHESDGFQLCDQVHCQVYRGRNKLNKTIANAAINTNNLVLVDEDADLITAAFFSNCGGQTCNSEDVWNLPKTYLKSVIDTFCIKKNNAVWKKQLTRKEWINYLTKEYKYKLHDSDSVSVAEAFSFSQITRKTHLGILPNAVPLKNIRADFSLKSTFFSVQSDSINVVLNGKGYGHGVGLCQEGAMEMAKLGYSYYDILRFYYQNVFIIDLKRLYLFKDDCL